MKLGEPPAWPSVVAVVGGGRMGAGIAEVFAVAGLPVRLADASPELARAARERVIERARGACDTGLLPPAAVERAQTVEAVENLSSAVAGVDLVLEAVAEDIAVKRDVLAACEAAAPEDTVIATNTSSLPVDVLAEGLGRPERFLAMHWFNPPEWTPGVEVVPAPGTDDRVVERVAGFLRDIGKAPNVVGAGVGFVANRLQMALFCEAARCVEEGLADPARIDEVVRSCFGFRLPFFGPFQIADMAGLDVYRAVLQQHRDGLGERFFVPDRLAELVDAGRKGTSSGAGLYGYPGGDAQRLLAERDERYAALARLLERLPPQRFDPPPD